MPDHALERINQTMSFDMPLKAVLIRRTSLYCYTTPMQSSYLAVFADFYPYCLNHSKQLRQSVVVVQHLPGKFG